MIEAAFRRAAGGADDAGDELAAVEHHCGSRPLTQAEILRVRGLSTRNAGAFDESIELLERGRTLARKGDDVDLADEIALTLSGAEAMAGRLDAAEELMREIGERRADTIGDKALAQLGAFQNFTAQYASGATTLDGLSARLEAAGELEWAARAASNRGWCLVQLGRADAAVASLERGRDLWLSLGAAGSAAQPGHHLAVAHSLLGKPKEALAALHAAWGDRELTVDDHLDAAEMYELAGLLDDALRHARTATSMAGNDRHVGMSESSVARLAMAMGRFDLAASAAAVAVDAFHTAGATDFEYAAQVLLDDALVCAGRTDDIASQPLTAPDSHGRSRSTVLAEIVRGDLALVRGDVTTAEQILGSIEHEQHIGGLGLRARTALLRTKVLLAAGDEPAALDAARGTIHEVNQQAAATGSRDLSTGLRTNAAALADLARVAALEGGDLDTAVEFNDRLRILDSLPHVEPTDAVRSQLAHYRLLRTNDADDDQIARTEDALRGAIRQAGVADLAVIDPVPFAEITDRLADMAMHLFIEAGGAIWRIDATTAGNDVHRIGTASEIEALAAKARMRLVSYLSDPERHDRRDAVMHTVARLDDALFVEAGRQESGVVLVPPPDLHGVPWQLCPHLAGRPLHVNSSATGWCLATRIERPVHQRSAFIAGPEPEMATREVEQLAAAEPGAIVLTGHAATTHAALNAIGTVDRAHLATHGVARTDNPLFSSLELADGPLTLYDLQTVPSPVEFIISACSVGRPRTYLGGLAVGFPAVMLAGGARTIVAPEIDVPDELTHVVMTSLHLQLRSEATPAVALQRTTTELLREHPAAGVTAAAFHAYGA